MESVDIPLRIAEGDKIVKDGDVVEVVAVREDEVQFATPAAMHDAVLSHEQVAQDLADANHVHVIRE